MERPQVSPAQAETKPVPPKKEPEFIPIPTWINEDPIYYSDDSSADEDEYGMPKPEKPTRFDAKGVKKPRPAYYYDADYEPATGGKRKPGRVGGMKGVPVFTPTMEEFADHGGFYGFVKRIEKYGMRSGIVKVIPPPEWNESLTSPLGPLKNIRLHEPISQHVLGSGGLYRVTNVANTRVWNPAQWRETCLEERYSTPDFKNGDKRRKLTPKTKQKSQNVINHEYDEKKQAAETSSRCNLPTPPSTTSPNPDGSSNEPIASNKLDMAADYKPTKEARPKKVNHTQRAEVVEHQWAEFSENYDELPWGMRKEDYSIDLVREIEKKYWKTLIFGSPPMYGADMNGSLFDDSTKVWNVAHLGDILPRLAPKNCTIPGVISPYLYFGMWRATFAWHVEDADLYSINYIHFGAPKFWYSVPQQQAKKFERVMSGFFGSERVKCSQFLRHKSFLASPKRLADNGIRLNRVVQLPGEFMLTYPNGYHSGFNVGFNCAESINFATERWLPIGQLAKTCSCVGDSVSIDVEAWLRIAAIAQGLLPPDPELELAFKSAPLPVKPKIEPSLEREKRARSKPAVSTSLPEPAPKRGRPNYQTKPKQPKQTPSVLNKNYACALCPDLSEDGLVDIESSTKKAHRLCAMFTPTTWIDTTNGEVIRGFQNIEPDRWNLSCQLCPETHGTKVQCTTQKCTKAVHVTCALKADSGYLIDASDESQEIQLTVLCRAHNPAWKLLSQERKTSELARRVNSLKPRDEVLVKTPNGVFEVSFLYNLPLQQGIGFAFGDGTKSEVKWKAIIWPQNYTHAPAPTHVYKDPFHSQPQPLQAPNVTPHPALQPASQPDLSTTSQSIPLSIPQSIPQSPSRPPSENSH